MLLKGERIVIPRSMQQDILQQIHAGHMGCYAWTETMTSSRTIYVRRDFNAKIAMHERWQLNVTAYLLDAIVRPILLYRRPNTSCL